MLYAYKKRYRDTANAAAIRRYTNYHDWEDEMIYPKREDLTDRELGKILGRGIGAIQIRRSRLRAMALETLEAQAPHSQSTF